MKIRVVQTRTSLVDVTRLSPDELEEAVAALARELPAVAGFGAVVAAQRELWRRSPDAGHALGAERDGPLPDVLPEVAARDLLRASALAPVVVVRGDGEGEPSAFRVRADADRRAFVLVGDKLSPGGVAADRPAQLIGFVYTPARQGGAALAVAAPATSRPPLRVALASGDFGVVQASVRLARADRRAFAPAPPPGAKFVPYSPELVAALRRSLGYATARHVTGAGVALALARAAAKGPSPEGLLAACVEAAPAPATPVPEVLANLVTRLAEVSPEIARTGTGPLAALMNVYRAQAQGIYALAVARGLDSDEVERRLAAAGVRRDAAENKAQLASRLAESAARALQLLLIAEAKFGEARAAALEAKAASADQLLAAMTKREREVVTLEYKAQEKERAARLGNRCPHVGLVDRLRGAVAPRDIRALRAKLEPFVGKSRGGKKEAWITCRSCGFEAVCPHVLDLYDLRARNAPYNEVRAAMARYAMRPLPAGRTRDAHTSYCRICGEATATEVGADDLESARRVGLFGELDEWLRRAVWAEALGVVDHVQFAAPVDPRQFARAASEVVRPLLLEAQAARLKTSRSRAKRSPVDADEEGDVEIEPIFRLHIAIFVYAFVFNLIRSSPKTVLFGGVKRPPAGQAVKLSRVAEVMLRSLMTRKSGVISRIEDITPEGVANRFREAYRALAAGVGKQAIAVDDAATHTANMLVALSPVYHYAATAARVLGPLPTRLPRGPKDAQREFETAMGRSLKVLANGRPAVRKSQLAQLLLGVRFVGSTERRVPPEFPRGADPLYVFSAPEVALFRYMFSPKGAKGAKGLPSLPNMKRGGAAKKKNKKPAKGRKVRAKFATASLGDRGITFEAAYSLFVAYTTQVTDAKTFGAYQKALAAVREGERVVARRRGVMAAPAYRAPHGGKADPRPATRVPLEYLYDENGLHHSWVGKGAVYIYDDGTEYTVASLAKRLRGGGAVAPLAGRKLVDQKCAVCGVKRSEVSNLDIGKIRESVTAKTKLVAFFLFYEARCPEGDLHDFHDAKCAKCGLVAGETARAYYDKYSATFEDQRREIMDSGETALRAYHAEDTRTAAVEEYAAFAKAWRSDFGLLVKAAELAGRPVAAFETIGATGGRLYPDVLAKKDAPPPPTSPNDMRLAAADGAVRQFGAAYNRLRFSSRIPKPDPATEELLALVPAHERERLSELLPDVFDGYAGKRRAVLATRSPADVFTFSAEELARMALAVAATKGKEPWLGGLAQKFARGVLDRILRSESLLSKNGPFDFGIFGADHMSDQDTATYAGQIADVDDEPGDAEPSAFSLEALDVAADDPNLEVN